MAMTFGVNSETFFALALISNQASRKEVVAQSQERQRERWQRKVLDPEIVIRRLFDEALPSIPNSVYQSLYTQLIRFHIDQIDFIALDYALRGQYGLFLKHEQENLEEGKVFSNQETTLFWNTASEDKAIFHRLKTLSKDWHGMSDLREKILKTHFQLHCATLAPTHEGSFLIQTFLSMSLERINWIEVAAHISGDSND